jgi:integrase
VSNLYRRAAGEGYVPPGYNPVATLIDKPCETRHEAGWLEVPDAALFLEAARTHRADARRDPIPFPHALIATFLLTGGRTSEVLGLRVDDLSFDRRTVTFRPNEYRRLKTATSHRSAPLWPQLEEILREYVFGGDQPRSALLFPSPRTGRMIRDTRKLLDALAARSGFERGQVRTRIFRHTYCAARLQTVDRGAPVSPYTVAKELGHGGLSLVERVYGHLGDVRHRSEVVEFRVEQHSTLDERLARLTKTG